MALKPRYPRSHRGCELVHNDGCIHASDVIWLIYARKGMQENESLSRHQILILYDLFLVSNFTFEL